MVSETVVFRSSLTTNVFWFPWFSLIWELVKKGTEFPIGENFTSVSKSAGANLLWHGFRSLLSMVLQFRRSTQAGPQTYVCAYTYISGLYIVLHTHTNCVRRAYCVKWMYSNHLEQEYLMSKYVLGVLPVWIKKKKRQMFRNPIQSILLFIWVFYRVPFSHSSKCYHPKQPISDGYTCSSPWNPGEHHLWMVTPSSSCKPIETSALSTWSRGMDLG